MTFIGFSKTDNIVSATCWKVKGKAPPLQFIDIFSFWRYNFHQVIFMTNEQKQVAVQAIQGFRLPRYHEIPDVGLYLEQTSKYLASHLNVLQHDCITASMISNYVKKGLIKNPVKKQYSRDQIAYLFFIAVAKNVLSLDALRGFIRLQQRTYSLEKAYNYFVDEFENLLLFSFELKDSIDVVGEDTTDERRLLFSCIAAVTQIIYLEKCLSVINAEE